MGRRNWAGYLAAYATWIVLLLLGLWLLLLAREAFLSLAAYYVAHSVGRARQIGFGDKALALLAGLLWLAFMIATEEYFRLGATRRDLARRLARVAGPELLLLFLVDLFLALLRGFGGWLRLLILGCELAVGVGLVLLARSRRTAARGTVPRAGR